MLAAIARAEDLRRARDLPPDAQGSRDPAIRRAAARSLARILDADDGPLLRALEDEDPETVAWAAYGLGESCRARQDAHVRALAARAASLEGALDDGRSPAEGGLPAARPAVDPLPVLVRALGRCGGEQAEPALRPWVRAGGAVAEAAAYALGDVAARAGSLSIESSSALLGASAGVPPLAAALYPFGRGEGIAPDEVAPRLVAAARAALGRPGPERVFAVRVLGRAGDAGAIDDLARVLGSDDFTPAERVEAARALARPQSGGKAGQAALADALTGLVAEGTARAKAATGDRFVVVLAVLQSMGDEAAARVEPSLWAVARLGSPPDAGPAALRRASALRCAAAEKLARAVWDADVLRACDVGDGEAGERSRLAALDRAPLVKARRAAWVELARSAHVRVREAALGAIARHPELTDAARGALAEALSAGAPGVVASAAMVVQAHPELVTVLAASERRAALDPASPPPTATPAREPDKAVATALEGALAHPWADDLVETRAALLDAAAAIGLDEGHAAARVACKDPNATVRARAARALVAYGEAAATCVAPDAPGEPAPELGRALIRPVRVVLDTDAAAVTGPLALRFDPVFAPLAVTRLLALARAGFYSGVVVHRVVPGFVVQLGDRGGDGYGGSGDLLRCETAPVPFAPFDVGVALAGRDTGSSQLFVTLARTPHLDGEYAWVGRAEGDWAAVAEGDVVRGLRVDE